jgi:iron-sulfur cluster repair protein YtfE (RIC family)
MSLADSNPDLAAAAVDDSADAAVVQSIIDHHSQLTAGLRQRVAALISSVETNQRPQFEQDRTDLLGYLRGEIVPHAKAEEQALYPPAGNLPEGQLLIAGMLDEHRAIVDLVAELAAAESPVGAASAARALAALFAVHLHKENELVLPLLLAAPHLRLAPILAGMHELLGANTADDHAG